MNPSDFARAMYPALRMLVPSMTDDPVAKDLPATYDECDERDRAMLDGLVLKALGDLKKQPEMDLGAEARIEELTRAGRAAEAKVTELQALLEAQEREFQARLAERSRNMIAPDLSLAITALLGLHSAKHGTPAAKRYLEAAVKLGDELAASILAPR